MTRKKRNENKLIARRTAGFVPSFNKVNHNRLWRKCACCDGEMPRKSPHLLCEKCEQLALNFAEKHGETVTVAGADVGAVE